MSHPSLRSRSYERVEEEENLPEQDHRTQTADELDTALRLAHHAQRLKAIEIGMENFSQALSAFKKAQQELLRRQTIISLAVGAICLAATLLSALWIQSSHPRNVAAIKPPVEQAQAEAAPTPAPVAPQAQPPVVERAAATPPAAPASPAPIQATVIEASTPAAPAAQEQAEAPAPRPVAMGRYQEASVLPAAAPKAAPVRQQTAFEKNVSEHLTTSSQQVPESWQAYFAREAKGDTRAKLQIAAKFLKGEEVKADPVFAVALIRQAATGGNKEAMMWLAYNYEAGNFGKPDPAAAAQWFSEAAKAGVSSAYAELGKLYEKGVDGAPDVDAALAWYQRGAQAGDVKAAQAVQRLSRPQQPESVLLSAEPRAAAPQPPLNATPVVARAPQEQAPPQAQAPQQQAQPDNSNERSADIRAAQRMLKVLGYKIDKADGNLGPQTQTAIRAYQRDHAAYPDGEFTPELVDNLTRDIRYGQ